MKLLRFSNEMLPAFRMHLQLQPRTPYRFLKELYVLVAQNLDA